MLLPLLTLATLSLAAAVAPPPSSQEFTVQPYISNGANNPVLIYNLIAVANKTKTDPTPSSVLLVATPYYSKTPPGSPAFFSGTKPQYALNYDLTSDAAAKAAGVASKKGVYGVAVPEGTKVQAVTATLNVERDFGWRNGSSSGITHVPGSGAGAKNQLFLCSDVVNGASETVLKWGAPAASGAPAGCRSVVGINQRFDL